MVVEGKQPVLIYFDEEGRFLREEQLDFRNRMVKPPPYSWQDCDGEELIEVLKREIGFEPGPIFVREFHSERTDVGVLCWDTSYEPLPGSTDPVEGEERACSLYGWYSTGQFVLPFGNWYWADGLGQIHTS